MPKAILVGLAAILVLGVTSQRAVGAALEEVRQVVRALILALQDPISTCARRQRGAWGRSDRSAMERRRSLPSLGWRRTPSGL